MTAGRAGLALGALQRAGAQHQIRGLGPIVLNVHDLSRIAQLLTEVMNMRRLRDYAAPDADGRIHVFAMGEGGPAAELHVIEGKSLPVARQGAGGVHHVAFRTPDEAQYHAWTKRLTDLRIPNSGEIDRFYFRSLYFISASRTASCSRSRPTAPALPVTRPWTSSAKSSRCSRSWSRAAPRSRPA